MSSSNWILTLRLGDLAREFVLARGYTLGGAAGIVGLAASVSVWSVGSALNKNYSDDNRSGSSAPQTSNALEGNSGARADSDAGRQAQGGSSQSSAYLNNFDKDSSNPNRSSTKSVGSIMGSAVSKVNAAAPTQASLQAEIDAGSGSQLAYTKISQGLTLGANFASPMIRNNTIQSSVSGIDVGATGIKLSAISSGAIFGNIVISVNTSLVLQPHLRARFTATDFQVQLSAFATRQPQI